MHHRHGLARGHEEVGGLAVAAEHLQLGDGVGLGHGVHQRVVPHLQLDLLQRPGHGRARARPLAVDVHDGEAALQQQLIVIALLWDSVAISASKSCIRITSEGS